MPRSLCGRCGSGVVWAKRLNGDWHPPLEHAGQTYLISDRGVVQRVAAYHRHRCDPEMVDDWAGEVRDRDPYHYDREATLQGQKEAVKGRPCPRCDADPDDPCMNLTERRWGREAEKVWPHFERLPGPVL
jgi:ribosomal protein S27AE